MSVKEKVDIERDKEQYDKSSYTQTTNMYQFFSCNDDNNLHLIRDGSTKTKDKRIQMASTTVGNYLNHIATVVYSSFKPVPKKWEHPNILIKGVINLISMTTYVTGAHPSTQFTFLTRIVAPNITLRVLQNVISITMDGHE